MKKFLTIFFVLCVISTCVFAQHNLTIIVKDYPSNTDAVYMPGSFNSWNPDGQKLYFDEEALVWKTTVSLPANVYQFKFTKGSWLNVETNTNGTDIENRTVKLIKDTTIYLRIAAWKDAFSQKPKQKTASPNVKIISEQFYIPELKRNRTIRIYLPNGYDKSAARYPVLYMHDGQNIFDEYTSAFGEWGVDEYLDKINRASRQCIVVGIDNGPRRLNEYNPYTNARFGTGEGARYARFIAQTLKPFVDKHYRTLPDKQNTAIGGSSMGGLISMYAILKHPGVFGTAMVFSPSFWIAPKMMNDIKAVGKNFSGRMYLYAGELESAGMVPDMQRAERYLKNYTSAKITTVVNPQGKHNEATWKEEFPKFYEWWRR